MTEITDHDIRELRREAFKAGDTVQMALCDLALAGAADAQRIAPGCTEADRADARAECERVIGEARASETDACPYCGEYAHYGDCDDPERGECDCGVSRPDRATGAHGDHHETCASRRTAREEVCS